MSTVPSDGQKHVTEKAGASPKCAYSMHQAVHFNQNSVLCSWPSRQHVKQMHCCGGARLCGQNKLYSVAKTGAPATSYVTFQPRSTNPTP